MFSGLSSIKADHMDKDRKERLQSLQREQSELRKMIDDGVSFDVDVKYNRRKPGLLGYFRKREQVTEKVVFTVKEPTLATLDRLSALWLDMEIDEAKLQDSDYLATAKQIAARNVRKVAEVVAVAVLGEDLWDCVNDKGFFANGGVYTRKLNETRLARLVELFEHSVTPSQLVTLAILITNVSNLGDFTNSIRLMSVQRTSEPISERVEPQD